MAVVATDPAGAAGGVVAAKARENSAAAG